MAQSGLQVATMSRTASTPAAFRFLRAARQHQLFAQPRQLRCSASSSNPSSEEGASDQQEAPPRSGTGFGQQPPSRKMSTADALRESLGSASASRGRVARSTNVVLGSDESEEKWRELDSQVNEYPGQRTFKAIGSGGQDFCVAMTACVQEVAGTVHVECINSRPSKSGKWLAVTIGPVWIETPEQVLEIFERMKADGRLKFYI